MCDTDTSDIAIELFALYLSLSLYVSLSASVSVTVCLSKLLFLCVSISVCVCLFVTGSEDHNNVAFIIYMLVYITLIYLILQMVVFLFHQYTVPLID